MAKTIIPLSLRHRRKAITGLGATIGVLGATGVALAAFNFNVPFVGSYSGEDLRTSIRAASAAPAGGNDPLCRWSVNADGAVTLSAPKLPRAPMVTTCKGDLAMSNDGETTLYVGGFSLAASPGATVETAMAASSCGQQVTPGNVASVIVRATFSNVQAGSTGITFGPVRSRTHWPRSFGSGSSGIQSPPIFCAQMIGARQLRHVELAGAGSPMGKS